MQSIHTLMTWKRGAWIAAIPTLLLLAFSWTDAAEYVKSQVMHRFFFQARTALGEDPSLDPRVKIFRYDAQTVRYANGNDISLTRWSQLFELLAKENPKAILVDKYFGGPPGLDQADEFNRRVKSLDVPVGAGAFVAPQGSGVGEKLDPGRPEFDLQAYLKNGDYPSREERLSDSDHWLAEAPEGRAAFGPNKKIRPAFSFLGNFNYDESGHGGVKPFLRLSRYRAVPQWSFLAADEIALDDGELLANGSPVDLDEEGRIIPNLGQRNVYRDHASTLHGILWRADRQWEKGLNSVSEGDVVLIIFDFTGFNDYVDTPQGRMEGGYVMASLVSSIMTGEWLHPVNDPGLTVLLFCGLGLAAALLLSPIPLIVSGAGLLLGWLATTTLLFVYGGYLLPALYPSLGFLATCGLVFVEKSRINSNRNRKIEDALAGTVSSERLDEIMRKPGSFNPEPCGKIVTIMFIDIVGYSLVAERLNPKQAFEQLKDLLAHITRIVHRYGGVVDKNLGDGLLCFFGYDYGSSNVVQDHATQAVDAAIEIQREILERNILAFDEDGSVYPLRIGINTAYVYIGDLRQEGRIEMTLIGDGVNLAQRLESACDVYLIMLGATTNDMLGTLYNVEGISTEKRLIKIKHHEDLLEAYELNPFADQPQRLSMAIAGYRKFAGIRRQEERWPIPGGADFKVTTEFANGYLVNFSKNGFAVALEKYIGKGVTAQVELQGRDSELDKMLIEAGLSPILAEVRWGRPFDDLYLHGFAIKNLTSDQKDRLFSILREHGQKVAALGAQA